MRILALLLLCAAQAFAGQITDLWARGFSVIPTPQKVELGEGVVVLDGQWHVDGDAKDIAFRSLLSDAETFQHLELTSGSGDSKVVRLQVRPGTVTSGAGAEIDKQAYLLKIEPQSIEITGNAEPGLFYGVQTLLQLLKRDPPDAWWCPRAVIEDWPKLQLRFLHWDTKHHQDRMETLKRYLDWSARFKVEHDRLRAGGQVRLSVAPDDRRARRVHPRPTAGDRRLRAGALHPGGARDPGAGAPGLRAEASRIRRPARRRQQLPELACAIRAPTT